MGANALAPCVRDQGISSHDIDYTQAERSFLAL